MDIKSEIDANVWKIEVAVGDRVSKDQTLMILESMKMEIPVVAPAAGVVRAIQTEEGASVAEDDVLLTLDEE
jgi:acetyl-CoA carboxylase biotin carboxyl carrier protein